MDAFNQFLQQFIKSKGRGTNRGRGKKDTLGKRFITVTGIPHPLYLDTPEFDEWLEEKREAFAGLEYLKMIKKI